MYDKRSIFYTELAGAFKEWYGVDKEKTADLLQEYGHEHIFNNAELLGLNPPQSEEIKKIFKIMDFYHENREVLENA